MRSFTPTDSKALGRFVGDTARLPSTDTVQRVAASFLVGKLEEICSSGVLSEESESNARRILTDAYRAFGFLSIAERS